MRNAIRAATLAVLVSAVLSSSESSVAQQRPTLQIVIEDPGRDAVTCGIDKSSLESIAALTLRNNGIQVVETVGDQYLYLAVNVIRPDSRNCVFDISVSVRKFIALPPTGWGGFKIRKSPVASAVLCEIGGTFMAPQGSVATHLSSNLENLIKLCLGKLDY